MAMQRSPEASSTNLKLVSEVLDHKYAKQLFCLTHLLINQDKLARHSDKRHEREVIVENRLPSI